MEFLNLRRLKESLVNDDFFSVKVLDDPFSNFTHKNLNLIFFLTSLLDSFFIKKYLFSAVALIAQQSRKK